MIESLTNTVWNFTQSFPEPLQWAAILVAGAIPLLEGHGAAVLGITIGVQPVAATISAISGNLAAMLVFASLSNYLRDKITPQRKARKKERIHHLYNRYGVPLVSLIAEIWLPSALTTILLISFGATKRQVIIWQTVTIIVWSVAMALIATGIITVLV